MKILLEMNTKTAQIFSFILKEVFILVFKKIRFCLGDINVCKRQSYHWNSKYLTTVDTTFVCTWHFDLWKFCFSYWLILHPCPFWLKISPHHNKIWALCSQWSKNHVLNKSFSHRMYMPPLSYLSYLYFGNPLRL